MSDDRHWMQRALQLARRGQGYVEPNPMVGCVVVNQDGVKIGEGFHREFGEPHAEVNALADCKEDAAGSTIFVTLEPCCHQGKTPPCSQAVGNAQPRRVVIATRDPFPQVAGGGIQELRDAGIEVDVGCLESEARALNAPYLKRVEQQRPWVVAKWAMTLDGKIASSTGSSQWISGEESRAVVHTLRGRVDAIMVGANTALVDDPRLDARPRGPRVATRIVMDGRLRLPLDSQLMETCGDLPLLLFAARQADPARIKQCQDKGAEVYVCHAASAHERLAEALDELGRRNMTNVLVEGGGRLLGSLFDLGQVDEVHAFCAAKIIGGNGPTPVAGRGIPEMSQALSLQQIQTERLGDDIYIHGRCGGGTP